jgi:hypothetical protein
LNEDLTRFGVTLADEGPHAFDPAVEWWNESWFWDWFDADGEVAGHCRIGLHPNQERAWAWFFLYRRGEWIAVEEPRLPLAHVALPGLAYDRFGLRFGWDVAEPLRRGRFHFQGFGRAIAGPRTGLIVPVGADLEVRGLGPPHSPGRATAAGHASERFAASRFEQPITAIGELRFGEDVVPFRGRGERDHSWGPRHWNLEWTFMVLNGEGLRLQCAEARVPNVGRFPGGYLARERTQTIQEVEFDLVLQPDDVLRTLSGRFSVKTEDGSTFGGEIATVSAAEIDITHTFVPPQRSLYRRALIRVRPDDGSGPLLGWLEFNRLAHARSA